MNTIVPGEVVELSALVRRITAPNGGDMTGPGTNTYLVGRELVAVIDPGPAIDSHIEAILAATDGRIGWIIVTHTHEDHSPAAAILAQRTGARLVGCMPPDDGYQDTTFQVGRSIAHGDVLEDGEFTLEAIHTPGHVANHYCYLLREEGLLFTGDHIMQGSTVVIIPPSGDMADYIASLEKLLDVDIATLAPGHGTLIADAHGEVRKLMRHRLQRETKVLAALRRLHEATIPALTPVVYDDVPLSVHPLAQISLWAILLKLEKEERALRQPASPGAPFTEDMWSLRDH